jgi:Domain of unknown function (DUF4389)
MTNPIQHPARLEIDYPEGRQDILSTLFRFIWVIPIAIILSLITDAGQTVTYRVFLNESGEVIRRTRDTAEGLASGLATATALMIIFRQMYPRWWFDFALEVTRFSYRVGAYSLLLTDKYPSTVDEQSIHLELDYPDVPKDLNRYMPIVKWLLAIPHYIALAFLTVGVVVVTIYAWFSILFTGNYPRGVFDFVVGVLRWALRVNAYAFLLITDRYPEFSLR